ncbi:beta-lactamase family protein [Streptomyces sp. ET3-23]|uniref:serine hydrolase domain-containing protein n=1 Tax=Streptomyces sp. ET3-23 TaxID=2885643 RepID=UPI001D118300|nr:serine hydrolase domain-containing protein [Streptomyces sp. ET3-23]MCC2278793.1 beta-lactamase family protein [Streptomyces sp. ET3-23]
MDTMKRNAWGTAVAALLAATAAGPSLDRDALRRSTAGLPDAGVTGALVRVAGSAGHWWGVSGVADTDTGAPVRSDSSFRIGGITRLFTHVVLLQLAGEQRADLDAPVVHRLPGLLSEPHQHVTVGQLLDGTSGLPALPSLTYGDGSNEWFTEHRFDSWSPERLVREALKEQREFTPGGTEPHNGIEAILAGLVIEEITGRPFAREVRERITRPLGLRGTYVPDADDVTLPEPYSCTYVATAGRLSDVTARSPHTWAAGGMVSTAADLDRFLVALLDGRLLPPAQQELLRTHGGLIRTVLPDGRELVGATGSGPGFACGVLATPDVSRRVAYSLSCIRAQGSGESPCVQRIVDAAFRTG